MANVEPKKTADSTMEISLSLSWECWATDAQRRQQQSKLAGWAHSQHRFQRQRWSHAWWLQHQQQPLTSVDDDLFKGYQDIDAGGATGVIKI